MSEQVDEILLEAEEKMDKAVEVARDDFATIRAPLAFASAAWRDCILRIHCGSPVRSQ